MLYRAYLRRTEREQKRLAVLIGEQVALVLSAMLGGQPADQTPSDSPPLSKHPRSRSKRPIRETPPPAPPAQPSPAKVSRNKRLAMLGIEMEGPDGE